MAHQGLAGAEDHSAELASGKDDFICSWMDNMSGEKAGWGLPPDGPSSPGGQSEISKTSQRNTAPN